MLTETRASGKGNGLFVEILIFLAIFLTAEVLVSIPSTVLLVGEAVIGAFTGTMDDVNDYGAIENYVASLTERPAFLLTSLYSTVLMTLTVILACRLLQKRRLSSLGITKKHALPDYLLGCLLGTAMMGAVILLCVLTGALTLEKSEFSIPLILLFFVGYLIQGMSEEVLCRGYFMPSVARRYPVAVAVAVNSLFFASLHLFNDGVTPLALVNITLFGVFASVYVLKSGNLWGACAIHSLWNFCQGNLFGIRVSGNPLTPSPFRSVFTEEKALWNGGSFGVEGGLAVTLVLALSLAVVLLLPARRETEADTENDFFPSL